MLDLKETLAGITGTNKEAEAKARARLDSLVKPPGSLGMLEEIAAKLSAITGAPYPNVNNRRILIFASDNGVVDEGVASAPQSVTMAQTLNFHRGITGVSVLAKQFNAALTVVDTGVNADMDYPGIINKKIRKSTGNICKEPAMTREEAFLAIQTGFECAQEAKAGGADVIGIGEMGIGNTTTTSAVLCALLGITGEVEKTAGRGAGLTNESYQKKLCVIKTALSLHKPDKNDPVDILSKVGGFDLAAMCGAFLGAAYCKLPVVIDGFISVTAALCAARINPLAKEYMFASHFSAEKGYGLAISELGMTAPLNLGMRLGEGSGCPLMFSLMDAACAVIKNMATFEEAMIDEKYLENIRGKDAF